jgi:23S rRNA pseudouridine955/2504/2580 synthase/23S rRNA pseudouridine1911/1915/1917 synthase
MSKQVIEIIYEDDEIFVVNKPAGISVTGDRSGLASLPEVFLKQLGGAGEIRLVHRLDKFASGVMIIAKSKEAQSRFSSWFEKRLIKKTYLALVRGFLGKSCGTIKTNLGHAGRNSQLMQVNRRGKAAITHWRGLADFGGVCLLTVEPVTMRTHQIRVHLANKGLPIVADTLYGSSNGIMLSDFKSGFRRKRGVDERPLIDRLALHAYQLEVVCAESAETMRFVGRLDKKFAATLKMLAKHSPAGAPGFFDDDDLRAILSGEFL